MPTILKLHEPEHYDVIRKMIQHDYVFWLDVEMRKADDEPALVGYLPVGSKLSRVQLMYCSIPPWKPWLR